MKIRIQLTAVRELDVAVYEGQSENDVIDEYQQSTVDDPFMFIDDAQIKLEVEVRRIEP